MPPETGTNVFPIDLPAALRLAGARNLDIQIARQRLNEAQANRQSAIEQFFPWVVPGVGYHRRDGYTQAVPAGYVTNTAYQSYSPNAALVAQVAIGDAIYNSLATKQLVKASEQGMETERQNAMLAAAQGYFDLAKARSLVEVANEAIQISRDYQRQLHAAVVAGLAFEGDELRVQSQTEHDEIALQQALEQERVAGINLSQLLHLDSRVALVPQDAMLMPLNLFPTNASLDALVGQALDARPELKRSQAFLAAARAAKNGTVYGPWVPTLGTQVSGGGLGGGRDGGPDTFGPESDYTVGLSWRIGPGGLFDFGRISATRARLAGAQLTKAKLKDVVISEVVASAVRVNSADVQRHLVERNLNTAGKTLRLTQQRKAYGVGIVLENIQAQQTLTQARSDYVTAVAEYDKAQYGLSKAAGGLTTQQNK